MRYIFVVFLLCAVFLGVLIYRNRTSKVDLGNISTKTSTEKEIRSDNNYKPQKILFVPYWTVNSKDNMEDFDTLAYFGISADKDGIDTQEAGYKNISKFTESAIGKKNYLVVRMLDSEIINDVLDSSGAKTRVIDESIDIARKNNFAGIILDLEFSAIPFDSVLKRVTGFYKEFYLESKHNGLEFSALLYGDTYYRGRPYEVPEISKTSDRIYIMAYDFNKARGNPGPNFPFEGDQKYGYSFKTMIDNFLKDVPKQKLVTVFGMFGYNWKIDDEGRGKELAAPMTNYQIESMIEKCSKEGSCKISIDNETKINFEQDGEKHEIWYENPDILKNKINFLNSQGLKSVGYWANSFWSSK